jgi:hypothetical protein
MRSNTGLVTDVWVRYAHLHVAQPVAVRLAHLAKCAHRGPPGA